MKTLSRPHAATALLLPLLFFSITAHALSRQDSEQAGAVLFRDKGCAYCHGPAGLGTQKGPSLANVRKTLNAKQIAHQILNGGQKMPSFEESVSPTELTELVAFLRAKHRPIPPPAAAPAQVPAT